MTSLQTSRRNRLVGDQWAHVKGLLCYGAFWKNLAEKEV